MRPLRPLLPLAEGSRRKPVELLSKGRRQPLACEACRQRKSKCDGTRPTCGTCNRRETVCHYPQTETRQIRQRYEQLRLRQNIHEELIDLLRTVAEQDATEIFRRIRTGADIASIVSHVRDGNLLMQLSLTPQTHRLYEFPYVSEMPSHLLKESNLYLDSLLYKSALPYLDTRRGALHGDTGTQDRSINDLPPGDPHSATNRHSAYSMPYHTAHMVEPIVEKITAAPWTSVISDNRLLRRLICSYFFYPHPCGPFVHKDLFLEDMAAGRDRFCSPLLVNAILAIASQGCFDIVNRSKVWLPDTMAYRFMSEARRLWDMEISAKSQITTIQAALILSYTTTNNSLDMVGTRYLEQAVAMSRDLDLFGPNDNAINDKMGKARIFTAWAVFSWQALFNFSFFRSPHLERLPQVALPDLESEPQWYGEIWIQYPHDPSLTPLYLGQKIQAEAALHAIMNELGLLMFKMNSSQSLALSDIIMVKRKIGNWMDTLPEPLQANKLVLPSHMTLHLQYHHLVMAFTQLVLKSDHAGTHVIANLYAEETQQSILDNAKIMFETITRLYYMRHSFNFYDPWIAFALTIIGNMATSELNTESRTLPRFLGGYRSTLILSAQGLDRQSLHYHNATLLAVQLWSVIKPEDLQLVRTYVKAEGISNRDHQLIAEHSHSQWPIPITPLYENPEKATLKTLVKAFEETQILSSHRSTQGCTLPLG